MVNLKQKISVSEEDMNTTLSTEAAEIKKSCADCHTTTTPLWRGGPAGPRSLCNACGIRLRKKRRAAFLGIDTAAQEKSMKKKKKKKRSSSNTNKLGVPLKMRLLALGKKIELGEEEQAAILLMALSCGSLSIPT